MDKIIDINGLSRFKNKMTTQLDNDFELTATKDRTKKASDDVALIGNGYRGELNCKYYIYNNGDINSSGIQGFIIYIDIYNKDDIKIETKTITYNDWHSKEGITINDEINISNKYGNYYYISTVSGDLYYTFDCIPDAEYSVSEPGYHNSYPKQLWWSQRFESQSEKVIGTIRTSYSSFTFTSGTEYVNYSKTSNLKQKLDNIDTNISTNSSDISTIKEQIKNINTEEGEMSEGYGELNNTLTTTVGGQSLMFKFVYNEETDEYGFIGKVDGADTFIPFRLNSEYMVNVTFGVIAKLIPNMSVPTTINVSKTNTGMAKYNSSTKQFTENTLEVSVDGATGDISHRAIASATVSKISLVELN